MRKGKFITVEGGEGVGKSTQIEAIRSVVTAEGFSVVLTREPGGTEYAERIRSLLLAPSDVLMPPLSELLLVFAARASHLEQLINPALHRGDWVICDRFTDATYAYQGGGRGMPRERIESLEKLVQAGLRPDLTILLDAPVELALARARQRNTERGEKDGDRFEREQTEFFQRVRDTYLSIARKEPDRIAVVDASMTVETVRTNVQSIVKSFIAKARPR